MSGPQLLIWDRDHEPARWHLRATIKAVVGGVGGSRTASAAVDRKYGRFALLLMLPNEQSDLHLQMLGTDSLEGLRVMIDDARDVVQSRGLPDLDIQVNVGEGAHELLEAICDRQRERAAEYGRPAANG